MVLLLFFENERYFLLFLRHPPFLVFQHVFQLQRSDKSSASVPPFQNFSQSPPSLAFLYTLTSSQLSSLLQQPSVYFLRDFDVYTARRDDL